VRQRFTSQTFSEVSSDAALDVEVPGAALAWGTAALYTAEVAVVFGRNRGIEQGPP
jgi:hypothetical protein